LTPTLDRLDVLAARDRRWNIHRASRAHARWTTDVDAVVARESVGVGGEDRP